MTARRRCYTLYALLPRLCQAKQCKIPPAVAAGRLEESHSLPAEVFLKLIPLKLAAELRYSRTRRSAFRSMIYVCNICIRFIQRRARLIIFATLNLLLYERLPRNTCASTNFSFIGIPGWLWCRGSGHYKFRLIYIIRRCAPPLDTLPSLATLNSFHYGYNVHFHSPFNVTTIVV